MRSADPCSGSEVAAAPFGSARGTSDYGFLSAPQIVIAVWAVRTTKYSTIVHATVKYPRQQTHRANQRRSAASAAIHSCCMSESVGSNTRSIVRGEQRNESTERQR